MTEQNNASIPAIALIPYHVETVKLLKEQTNTWDFFSKASEQKEHWKQFKTDLLKNTYKFDAAADEHGLYKLIDIAKGKLGLSFPVTIYQAQNTDEINASIAWFNKEAHIVLSGRILQLLDEEELQAVLAHELSHICFYEQLGGEMEVADRIITALGNHAGSTAAHYQTARLFKLYTEVFCDRGAYLVCGKYQPVISSLVKIATGLQKLSADSYVQQADEIFASDNQLKTAGISHPENFIRARAIYLWHTKGEEATPLIQQMIEGAVGMDELDLHQQHTITAITQQLIQLLLAEKWMQTAHTKALAKQYFKEIKPGKETIDSATLSTTVLPLHSTVKEYLAYVLYDFATADKTLEDVPLGYAFHLAEILQLEKPLLALVKKERKLTDKKATALKKQVEEEYLKETNVATAVEAVK